MGSSRLPGKVLMKIDNFNTLITSTVNQLKSCKLLDDIIIATTTNAEDDEIIQSLKKSKIKSFRGDSTNVLDRFYQCAKSNSISTIVRITCDNPLIDPTVVDNAISQFNLNKYDYVTNIFPKTFPQGTETEVFSFHSLTEAWKNAKKPSEQEHVTPYFYNNPKKFKILNLFNKFDLSDLRWTIDNEKDLQLVREISRQISKRPILMTNILELFKKNPSLIQINKTYVKNEGYLKSLKEDKKQKL
jgi:spore coat polysaccharide biosynthesis protein SpsF